jgi:hypothetical protein
MPDKEKKALAGIIVNNALSTVFVDNLTVSTRSDGMNLVRFTAALPEGFKEEARLVIPTENLKRMLEVLCEQCNYFPTKKKPIKPVN